MKFRRIINLNLISVQNFDVFLEQNFTLKLNLSVLELKLASKFSFSVFRPQFNFKIQFLAFSGAIFDPKIQFQRFFDQILILKTLKIKFAL